MHRMSDDEVDATVVSFGAPEDLEAVERTLALPSTSSGHPGPARG